MSSSKEFAKLQDKYKALEQKLKTLETPELLEKLAGSSKEKEQLNVLQEKLRLADLSFKSMNSDKARELHGAKQKYSKLLKELDISKNQVIKLQKQLSVIIFINDID